MTWLISILIASAVFSNGTVAVDHRNNAQSLNNFTQTDETERFEQTYPFSPGGNIEVGNVNGSITIETWDKPQIRLEVVKIADTKERLSEVQITINATQESFSVAADYESWKNKNRKSWGKNSKLEVNFHLIVPKTAFLDEIHTVNGSVSVSNSANFTKASSVNGSVKAVNVSGNADLSTINGSVEAEYQKLDPGNVIELSTVNGTAKLVIPSNANATVRAGSLNGEITNDFGLPVRKGKYVGRDMYGKIGNGDVKIKLESVNGRLAIMRQNDGKSTNPAINLLPAKSDDDEDSDNDFDAALRDSRIDLREAQREIANARREMEKTIRASGIEAEKAALANSAVTEAMKASVEALKPEIAKINEEAMKSAIAAIESVEVRDYLDAARSRAMKAVIADQRLPWRTPFVEEKTGSYSVKGTPDISINASNCSISVSGWAKSEVKYSLSKIASNVAQKPVEFESKQLESGKIDIRVDNQNSDREVNFAPDSVRVFLKIYVPAKSNLKITTNGEIRVEGVSGDLNLNGEDEPINVRDSGGKLVLHTQDGTARVIGFTGELEANLQDGELFIEGDFQKIRASAQDGKIILTVPEDINANIISNSEAVASDGINLVEEGKGDEVNRWKIGKGGKNYVFNFDDGSLTIRSRRELVALF